MSLLQHAPRFAVTEARELARELYGLDALAMPLPSERDQNFRLETSGGTYVLKISNAAEQRASLEAQNAAMAICASAGVCQTVIAARSARAIEHRAGHFIRLVTWLPGVPLGSIRRAPDALLEEIGATIGAVDTRLEAFDHAALHRDFPWDLARGLQTVSENLALVDDPPLRAMVSRIAERVAAHDAATFARLRRSAVHNDPNDYNVLIDSAARPTRVTGLIDFGDMVHSFAVADLAVATAYAVLDRPDPMAAAAAIARGYHSQHPVSDEDIAALWPLVLLRLAVSVCMAARQQRERPDDAYLAISQAPIRRALPALAAMSAEALDALGTACGRAGGAHRARGAPAATPPEPPGTGGEAPEDAAAPAGPLLSRRAAAVGPSLRLAYRQPLTLVRGSMQYLYDEAGRQYLDAYNNVPHVGHGHRRVVAAAEMQLRTLNTNTRYLHASVVQFAERLVATLPAPLRVCYFVSSGSEANELALRLARAHTRSKALIVLDAAYHGNTTTLIDISPYKFDGPGGEGKPPWVHVAPLPDVYRGPYGKADLQAGARYAEAVASIVADRTRDGPVNFIAETCPSVAGQIVPPPGYLAAVYAHVRAAGGVCIADEVQTAYGRMGTSFYAFEDQQVTPDIVVLGKPIGNGYPLGAVVTTEAIARSFDNGMEFFSTFGGSTAACAVGLAVLEVVDDEGLQAHALEVGAGLLAGLQRLQARHALIGDVRGSGLFVGVELVRDRDTRAPATREAADVVERLREEGILMGTDGPAHNVLKIRPPMPFTEEDADTVVRVLDRVLGEITGEGRIG